MNLPLIDTYSSLASPVHRLNPVAKLISFLAFVVVIVLSPGDSFTSLVVALLTLCCITLASRVSFRYVLCRTLVIVPFIVAIGALNLLGRGAQLISPSGDAASLAAGSPELASFLTIAGKSFVSALGMVLLVTTTGSARLLNALRKTGVPAVLTAVTCFMFRYVFVVADELATMKRSRDSRCVGKLPWITQLRSLGTLVGVLFIRSFERAERVYAAMCSRGFDGLPVVSQQPGISSRDILFPVLLLGPVVLTILIKSAG